MEKIKQIAKYTTNILGIIGALVYGINAVEGITIPYAIQVVKVIMVIQGVIGTYLLGNKVVSSPKTDITIETLDELSEGRGDDEDEIKSNE